MAVEMRYEPSKRYTDERMEVYANKANVGTLQAMGNQLNCYPDDYTHNVKFQFRNYDTFAAVVEGLRQYKNEQGYKYITIWTYNYGYAAVLDRDMIEKVGFKHLPDNNPACFFLE